MPDAAPPVDRIPAGLVLLVLVAATWMMAAAVRTPTCLPASAPLEQVSGARSMQLLQRCAVLPHPIGTPEHDRVQALLVQELTALGFAPELQPGVYRWQLTNVVVPISGSQSTGTVLCMAHYDSVPTGPGAGDDGAGTVTWLEVLRALHARGWQPRNDVMLLLTDGEEYGMLGAHLFAREDRRAAQVRTIVNLEAIGDGGPAYLFELGKQNAARVRDYAAVVARPAGSSAAEAIYHLLPNNTDLSVFLKRGVQGFNLALASSSTAYHAPHDTPANLDPGSLQHMADSALALLLRLGDADLKVPSTGDVTFFDLLGCTVIAYPRGLDAWMALAALLLSATVACWARRSWRGLVLGLLRHLVVTLVVGGALLASWWGLDQLVAKVTPEPDWVPGNITSGFLLLAGVFWLALASTMPRAACDPAAAERRLHAGLVWWSTGALAMCAYLPGSAFVVSWPAIMLVLGALLPRPAAGRWTLAVRLLALAASFLLVLPILHLLVQLLLREPLFAAGLACLVTVSLAQLAAPQLLLLARRGRLMRIGAWAVGAGALSLSVVVARVLGWRSGSLWQ